MVDKWFPQSGDKAFRIVNCDKQIRTKIATNFCGLTRNFAASAMVSRNALLPDDVLIAIRSLSLSRFLVDASRTGRDHAQIERRPKQPGCPSGGGGADRLRRLGLGLWRRSPRCKSRKFG
jgi:hypothetical protein